MKFRTHLMFAVLIGLLYIKYNPKITFFLIILGSLIPDIDIATSKVGKKVKISKIIEKGIGHRTLFHSIWIPALFLFYENGMPIFIGYLSHLFLDSLTKQGINIIWPLKPRLKGFIKTGSFTETIIFIVLLFIVIYLGFGFITERFIYYFVYIK